MEWEASLSEHQTLTCLWSLECWTHRVHEHCLTICVHLSKTLGIKMELTIFWAWMWIVVMPPYGWQNIILCQYEMMYSSLIQWWLPLWTNTWYVWMTGRKRSSTPMLSSQWGQVHASPHLCGPSTIWRPSSRICGNLEVIYLFFSLTSALLPTRTMCISVHSVCLTMRLFSSSSRV